MKWRQRLGWWLIGVPSTVVDPKMASIAKISTDAYNAMDTLVLKFPGSYYSRQRGDNGVTMKLHLADGSVIVGVGATTNIAIGVLWTRAGAIQQ